MDGLHKTKKINKIEETQPVPFDDDWEDEYDANYPTEGMNWAS